MDDKRAVARSAAYLSRHLLLACGILCLLAPAYAAEGVTGFLVRYRDGVVADANAPAPEALHANAAMRLGAPVYQGPGTRTGALRLMLAGAMSIDEGRAAANRLRLNPDVLYVSLITDAPPQAATPAANARPIRQLIVKYKDQSNQRPSQSVVAARLGRMEAIAGTAVALERTTSRNESIVRLFAPLPPDRATQVAMQLEQDAEVEYANPDYWVYPMLIPNDPKYTDTTSAGQWHLKSSSAEPGGANLPAAWDLTTGSNGIVVAVIDTGILFGHPDLVGRTVPGYDMISDPLSADDGNGQDPDASDTGDWRPASYCYLGQPARSSSWHGTHVAGTIGAATNNGTGVSGINWISRIQPVRVLGACPGMTSDIDDAIAWASGGALSGIPANPTPARVLNLSLGGLHPCASSTQTAINGALARGAVLVVSAGNENDDAYWYGPANCGGVIAVAANQRQGYKAEYSNYGTTVDIAAPGGGDNYPGGVQYNPIWSTHHTGLTNPQSGTYSYAGFDPLGAPFVGTSMAAPHVAGIASLMLSVNPALTPPQVLSKIQTTARTFPLGGPICSLNPSNQYSCQCTTSICGAGIIDAAAAVASALPPNTTMPGTATISGNTYGTVSVTGATLNGPTLSNIQPGAVIQLGSIPGTQGSAVVFDFQGLNIGAGNTLTIRSGAANQSVLLWNADANGSTIAGTLRTQGANGAPAPYLMLYNQNGVTVPVGGSIVAPAGAEVSGLGYSWTVGQPVINQGVIDGGPNLWVNGIKIGGGGAYKGNSTLLSTPTFANNPVNGAHFLSNGLHLYPSSGTNVDLTLHAYGTSPQVLNVFIHGNGTAWMPSSWGAGVTAPPNNAVVPPGGSRPPGTPEPTYGGGSMIVQASGNLQLVGGPTNDFVFPGAIAIKAGGTLDLNGVVINQGWTITGKPFQGPFFESPNIVSPAGFIRVLSNNPNWINFSTMPKQKVRTWSLAPNAQGGASYIVADSFATHINSYSLTTEAAANGECWLCLINPAWVNMY